MSTVNRIVTCDCGQRNRLPLTLAAGKALRCGACHTALFEHEEDDEEDEEDAGAGLAR